MNQSGYRGEEKKSIDPEPSHYQRNTNKSFDTKSQSSYKSTQSSRSSVLQRAREYSKRIEEQQRNAAVSVSVPSPEDWNKRRSKSAERNTVEPTSDATSSSRSQSANRATQQSYQSSRPSTRERAMASVRKDTTPLNNYKIDTINPKPPQRNNSRTGLSPSPSTPATSQYTTSASSYSRQTATTPVSRSTNVSRSSSFQQNKVPMSSPNFPPSASGTPSSNHPSMSSRSRSRTPVDSSSRKPASRFASDSPSRSMKSEMTEHTESQAQSQHPVEQQQQQPVVTPELLVDALSGHEDGLLAIAEKLMEHYDSGYDVMGEAIIDAFADVQKLFQHVVEAAHMEGAAFESSRREEELVELRRQVAMGGTVAADLIASGVVDDPSLLLLESSVNHDAGMNESRNTAASPNGPTRHDEFIDQDVKDVLTEAIKKGSLLRGENKHHECYEIFERACQDASSSLPVDSDHRGRLQLSLARAESMSADRSCAILRYAMDDVLRSGMRAVRTPLPDPSKRADVVLNRPKGHPSITGASGQAMAGVIQSSDEALASLIEEMKDIISAPIYKDTPLQSVAKRFWAALNDSQKVQQKNEERLEQNLGKLKGEFLLARSEWEEKLSKSSEVADSYKDKYIKLKENMKNDKYLEQARLLVSKVGVKEEKQKMDEDMSSRYGSVRSGVQEKAGSVVSGVSGLAQQAKSIVSQMNNFNCSTLNERTNESVIDDDDTYDDEDEYESKSSNKKKYRERPNTQRSQDSNTTTSTSTSANRERSRSRTKQSRSFRDYSKSPKRVDV